ncbi:MAG TPA: ATP-binding protein [Myxococcota bacterium]|jgi:two-component system NtrC family sensor kinase|nr:ATP-binding protein [Myxococcota bacterium]
MEVRPQRLLDYREFPVLYVDDEPGNLRIFELGFRRDFTIVTAPSGEAGLDVLSRSPVAVVLSDQKMPGLSGVEFLARVRELDPKTVRMLITAYGDAATLGSAINESCVWRYVAKPWHPEDLRLALRRAIELYALDREREQLVRELSTLNRVARSINQELALERLYDLLLDAVVRELGFDAASLLVFDEGGRVLRLARSAPRGPQPGTLASLELRRADSPRLLRHLDEGEPLLLSLDQAAALEPPVRAWLTEVAADQMLIVPLVAKSRVLGAIAIDNRRGGAAFEADERLLLDGFATQAAIAIANAQLVDALQRSRNHVARADRLGTVGTLAAGVAHEINNPLVSIQTFLTLAPGKRSENDPEFWGPYHQLAVSELERIRGLVATMSRLARGGGERVQRAPCELHTIVDEAVRLVHHEACEAEVTVEVQIEPGTPKVVGVREQLHQVLLNLLLNAIQATPRGGRISVRSWGDLAEPASAWLEVSDTGRGIEPAHVEQIFDPFFTTKGPDLGTGLGLMICHHIVSDHGGTIEVESVPGAGARFRVRLPVDGGPVHAVQPG